MKDERIRNIKNDRSAKLVGIQLVKVREGYAVNELTLNENHLNGLKKVQGGVMSTLDGVG
jgi:acyl-coenzyme A thioesterase PaaI-like protein